MLMLMLMPGTTRLVVVGPTPVLEPRRAGVKRVPLTGGWALTPDWWRVLLSALAIGLMVGPMDAGRWTAPHGVVVPMFGRDWTVGQARVSWTAFELTADELANLGGRSESNHDPLTRWSPGSHS